MFGKNPSRSIDPTTGKFLYVKEIFPTIQGEGPFAGRPAVFVRLLGCNLRCWFCDTNFEPEKDEEARDYLVAADEIVARIEKCAGLGTDLVVITGGEPFRQDLRPLIKRLRQRGQQVQIETAGTLPPTFKSDIGVDQAHYLIAAELQSERSPVTVVCSPKTPHLNPRMIPFIGYYKYLVPADPQLTPAGEGLRVLPILATQSLPALGDQAVPLAAPPVSLSSHRIFMQPLDYDGNETLNQIARRAAVDLCLSWGYRLSLQQHKIVKLP